MRTFILLWLGQIASSVGSHMTYFALTLWVWQQTESATAVALILFFYQLPQIAIALFSGLLIDRISRKALLILSDTGSACCTISVGILAITQTLQVWHLYVIAAVIGSFGHIQSLTYTTIIPMLVPQEHHMRAAGMGAMAGYSTGIFAPALAGILYPEIGLFGITVTDMGTFAIAALTLLFVSIPTNHVADQDDKTDNSTTIWQTLTFGFRYIFSHLELRSMIIVLSSFAFLHQIGETLYQPIILARTGSDTKLLGTVVAAAGVGGLIGGGTLTLSDGFRNPRRGLIIGMLSVGIGKLIFSFGQGPVVWTGARLGTSISEPMIFSTYTACWYAMVPANLQGRAFAADHLIGLSVGALASLVAGPLADYVFEPGWISIFGPIAVPYPGFGMTVLYSLTAVGILTVSIIGRTQLPPLPSLGGSAKGVIVTNIDSPDRRSRGHRPHE